PPRTHHPGGLRLARTAGVPPGAGADGGRDAAPPRHPRLGRPVRSTAAVGRPARPHHAPPARPPAHLGRSPPPQRCPHPPPPASAGGAPQGQGPGTEGG